MEFVIGFVWLDQHSPTVTFKSMARSKEIHITLKDGQRRKISVREINYMSYNSGRYLLKLKSGESLHLTQKSYLQCVPLYSDMLKGKFII
jgi:hypothetical protein